MSGEARGFTLVEVLLLIVVLAIGLAGILVVVNATVVASAEPLVRKQAMAAAESMLEEILLQPFAIVGAAPAPTQANRASFDDVRDYDGFATAGIYAIDGAAPIAGLGAYNLSVAVALAALGSVPAADALRVTVTVTGPNFAYALDGYKLAYP
jgi:MSHA pilin protein MshD